jgi:hypothetical protein
MVETTVTRTPRRCTAAFPAARKLLELANEFEPIQDGRIYIEKINGPFLFELKGTPAAYKAVSLQIAIGGNIFRLTKPPSLTFRMSKVQFLDNFGGALI